MVPLHLVPITRLISVMISFSSFKAQLMLLPLKACTGALSHCFLNDYNSSYKIVVIDTSYVTGTVMGAYRLEITLFLHNPLIIPILPMQKLRSREVI